MPKDKTSELPFLVMNAGRMMMQRMHFAGGAAAPSMLQFKIISFVLHRRRASMKEIAEFLGITPPSATVLIKRLVKSKELSRVTGTEDRRTVMVTATAAGKRKVAKTRREMAKRLGACLGCLTAQEKSDLANILKRFMEGMSL